MPRSALPRASHLHWLDRLLPASVLQQSRDEARSARVLLIAIASASSICLLFTFLHWSEGNLARALVSGLSVVPIVAASVLLWWSGRVQPSVHYMLAVCTLIVCTSSLLVDQGEPMLVALVIVPIAAAMSVGSRAGACWSAIIVSLLAAYAVLYPFDNAAQKVAWQMTIVAAWGGIAASLVVRGREQANAAADRARKRADADAEERLRAERALRESQALFATAFRQSSSLLVIASLETGAVLDVNGSFERITGWTLPEVAGKTLDEIGAWKNASGPEKLYAEALATGQTGSIEIRMTTRTGATLWLLASAEVLEQDGRACILAEGVDITERKRSEQALARYREQLEDRFAERGEQLAESLEQLRQRDRLAVVGTLAAGVAHQINNPIGAIVAATELAAIMDGDPDREQIRSDALATAHDEAERCGRIVKNILKFSRDEPTDKWIEDISATVARATQLARKVVTSEGGRLEMELAAAPLEARASPIDIEQVVLNLIHNASQSKPGGADVRVETRSRDGYAEIIISDDGDGIDPDARPHIFEPFYTSRLAEGGSGLGLSVVHGIVGDHEGRLEVEDRPGGGTRIRVLLPLAREDRIGPAETTRSDAASN